MRVMSFRLLACALCASVLSCGPVTAADSGYSSVLTKDGDVVVQPANSTAGVLQAPGVRVTGHAAGAPHLDIRYREDAGVYNIGSAAAVLVNNVDPSAATTQLAVLKALRDRMPKAMDTALYADMVTLDSGGGGAADVGGMASMALSSQGHPRVAYRDFTNNVLKLAICFSANCSGAPLIQTIDGPSTPGDISLALDSAGRPVIAYRLAGSGTVRVAVCSDVNCSSSTANPVGTSSLNSMRSVSVKLNSNNHPIVTFMSASEQIVKLALCSDTTCAATITTRDLVSGSSLVGQFTSLVLDSSGHPRVAYYDASAGDLKLAVCSDATCLTAATIRLLDDTGNCGLWASLKLNAAGHPVVSHYEAANSNADLRLAVCSDATCSTTPTRRVVDSEADVGQHTALALTAEDLPVIAYTHVTLKTLKVAVCGDPTCSPGLATIRTLDAVETADNAALWTSMALGAKNHPVIAYYDQTAFSATVGALKIVACRDPTCV